MRSIHNFNGARAKKIVVAALEDRFSGVDSIIMHARTTLIARERVMIDEKKSNRVESCF